MGAKHYLGDVASKTGKLVASDMMVLDEGRVATEWYLWEGERPNVETYARRFGYVAVRYKDELYELASNKPTYRNFGVSESLNQDAPILLEAIKHHQDQYPDIYADEVRKTVQEVYGEVAVAKVAHSQKLAAKVSELHKDYRSEKALTVALMGLLAEEMLIGVRLGKLGKKKAA
jgi:hypothetical protein